MKKTTRRVGRYITKEGNSFRVRIRKKNYNKEGDLYYTSNHTKKSDAVFARDRALKIYRLD